MFTFLFMLTMGFNPCKGDLIYLHELYLNINLLASTSGSVDTNGQRIRAHHNRPGGAPPRTLDRPRLTYQTPADVSYHLQYLHHQHHPNHISKTNFRNPNL